MVSTSLNATLLYFKKMFTVCQFYNLTKWQTGGENNYSKIKAQ